MLTRFLFCLLLCVRTWATYDLPANRKPPAGNWQLVGIPGGIPTLAVGVTVTNSPYNLDPSGVTNCDTGWASALAACPVNQALYFPPGTYKFTNVLNITTSHAIRGAGPLLTRIKSSTAYNVPQGNGAIVWFEGSGSSANMLATNGLRGDTSVKLTSVAGLSVGQWVTVKEDQDSTIIIGTTQTAPPTCLQAQQCIISGISGTNVTLDRALYWDFKTNLNALLSARTMLTNCGVENIYLEQTSTNTPAREYVHFVKCAYCWVTNMVGTNSGEDGIALDISARCNIQHNTCLRPQKILQSMYAYHVYELSDENLIENNIADGFSSSFLVQIGAMGNVIAYNYMHRGFDLSNPTTSLKDGTISHGDFANFNLFEGNNVARIGSDNFWGCNVRNTWLRNWSRREHLNENNAEVTDEMIAVNIEATNYYANFIGNILCSPRDVGDFDSGGSRRIWKIGDNIDNTTGGIANGNDTNVLFTMTRHGNFDFPTNAVAWDPGIADHVLTNSYYLTSKPAWWGPSAWPPYGPDVAVSISTNITANHLIPAEVRYFTGLDPGQVVTNIIFAGTVKINGAVRTP